MVVEITRLRGKTCSKTNCSRITINKSQEYEIHQTPQGFIIKGPLPGIICDRFYDSNNSARKIIENHYKAIETELSMRQLCLIP